METAEAVVIGGGVAGTSTAFWLARKGLKRVVLLERTGLALGATGRSAAFIRLHYTNPWDALLALRSLQMFQDWKEMVGGECGFRRTGFLCLAGRHEKGKLLANIRLLRGVGVNTTFLPPEDLRLLQPFMEVEDLAGAAYEPESGYADGSDTAHSLARRFREMGGQVQVGVPALRLLVHGGRVKGVQTTQWEIEAPTVVLAAGAWSAPLAQTAGVALPITPKRLTVGILQRPTSGIDHLTVIDHSLGFYFRPEGAPEARLSLVGFEGSREGWTTGEAVDPDNFKQDADYPQMVEGARKMSRRIPALAEAYWKRTWSGVDGYTPDGHILLGAVPEVQGLYIATGGSGTNFKTGPAVGLCMAELILEGEAKTVDIAPFRPSRFAEGKPIVGEYEYTPLPEEGG